MPENHIKHNSGAGVSDVADVIGRNAADIDPDSAFCDRLKNLFFPRLCIIYSLWHIP
jgi:hypothetical protein